ncbi:MAG: c-type cytochrome, partial [Cellulomonadaceae bacterium]|nr:c-type cytochrome [Cellulomonadaceae bacterium]
MKAIAARRHHRLAPMMLLALALLVTGAAYAAFAPEAASAPVASQTDVEAGQALFQANCATCHGPSAEGRDGAPSLIGVGAAAVDFQVSTGRMPMAANGPQAPAGPRQLDEEQTAQLAAYVASLGAGPSVPTDEQVDPALGNVANGMALFRTNCAMCHGAVGAGGSLSRGKYAPDLRETDPRAIFEAMVTGPQSMPVFSDTNIDPDEKRDIIAF